MRILGAVCASILASAVGTLAACGSPETTEPPTAETVNAASVSIALMDANGTKIGDGSGVLIAPRLVLTAGHLVAGKAKWVVTAADGKTTVTGSRGMTYDWREYESQMSHPRKHDVGVIYLDESIKLSAYPKLVSERAPEGAKATRIRGTGGGFQALDASLGRAYGAPNSYLADIGLETLDTGGAVFDDRGILGVVSGRGLTTGKLHIARTDRLTKWLAPKIACSGGALGARTFSAPPPKEEICEDGGVLTPGAPGAPGTPGGPGDSCEGDDNGYCSGNCSSGAGGTTPGSSSGPDDQGSSGNSPSTNPGGGSEPGGSDGSDDGDGPGKGGAGSNAGSSGSDGNVGDNGGSNSGGAGGSSGGPPGAQPGTPPSGGASGGKGGTGKEPEPGEPCQGPSDNPEVCPPEPDGCVGPSCGGGKPDLEIDYGNCACGSSSKGIYLR